MPKISIRGVKKKIIKGDIFISGSKSESNRLLILQKLFSEISIENLSDSDDSIHMQNALKSEISNIDIGHAGTTMRFLIAFFANQENKTVILSGSERMHNRPIKALVDTLRSLGADISYTKKEGYPPLAISGKKLTKDFVQIEGSISSQYISAILLVAPSLPNGLTIELLGKITSISYIQMTLGLMNQIGIETQFEEQIIKVAPFYLAKKQTIVVESDWSSASYFYSIIALSEIDSKIILSAYKTNSLQGDSVLSEIYKHFGVETVFGEGTILLKKVAEEKKETLTLNLAKTPDIAQTIAVTSFGLGVACDLTGLHTLKIKETDRLEALKEELSKLGANISVTNHSLHLENSENINSGISIETYHDHRMAMAFAPLAIKAPINILEPDVVTKSYRNFWKDLQQIGFLFD